MVTKKTQNFAEMIRWGRRYCNDVIRLSGEWIDRFFSLGESVLKILVLSLQEEIIDQGGGIFPALRSRNVVGCCALMYYPDVGGYDGTFSGRT